AFQEDPHAASKLYGYTNPYRVAWLQQDFFLDLRDKPLAPHKGGYLGTTLEEGGIYTASAFTYEKVLPEMRLYVPMGSQVTLAAARARRRPAATRCWRRRRPTRAASVATRRRRTCRRAFSSPSCTPRSAAGCATRR